MLTLNRTQPTPRKWRYNQYRHHRLLEWIPWGYIPDFPRRRSRKSLVISFNRSTPTHIHTQDQQGRELVHFTNLALEAGIKACGPGLPFKGIGEAIHNLLKPHPYSISSQFSGHGIGKVFHSKPHILHHRTLLDVLYLNLELMCDTVNSEPGKMQAGHCFTIEVRMRSLYTL